MKKLLFSFMKYYSKGNIRSFFVYLEAIIVLLVPVILVVLSFYFYIEKTYQLDFWLLNSDNGKISGRFKAFIVLLLILIPTAIALLRLRTSIFSEMDDYMRITEKSLTRLRITHYIACAFAFALFVVTIFSIY